jgi:hypothetical protein
MVKKSRRTKKKYSERKYLNKAKTNRRYSKNKYTRRKHTRRKNTRRKHKKKLRGGMKEGVGVDADEALFASAVAGEVSPSDYAFTTQQRSDDIVKRGKAAAAAERGAVELELEPQPQPQPQHYPGMWGNQMEYTAGAGVDLRLSGELVDLKPPEHLDMTNYTDWYIKTNASGREKEGHKTTDDLELTGGAVIKYVEKRTGDHQWYLSNALVAGQEMLGLGRTTEKYGYYEAGKIFNALQNEEGKWVKDQNDTTGQSFNAEFKGKYHIKVVNEGFNIKTDFLNGQYVITFQDDPHNPLVLEFDTFLGESLTIDKYVTSGAMDLYRISMNIGGKDFYSDIRWSAFEKLVKDCMKAIEINPSFGQYSKLGSCQKDIEEIQTHLEAKRSEYTQIAAGVAKGMYRVGSGLAGGLGSMVGRSWYPPTVPETESEQEMVASGAAASPAADAADEYKLQGKPVNASDLSRLDNPTFGNLAARRFMIVSIARLIKCGFLSIVYKHLDGSQGDSGEMESEPGGEEKDKSLVVTGEGSKQLGFFGGALELAKTPTNLAMATFEKGKSAAAFAGAAAGQVAQNIFEGMVPDEWVHLKQEVSKELLYERMCSFGKGFDEQVADSIANIANATKQVSSTMGYEGLAEKAETIGTAAGNYGDAKQAVNIAATAFDWWTSLNPTTGAAKFAGKLAWKGVTLGYYVQKVKNNNGKAQKAAQDLWKSLCLLLAECELDEEDPSNKIIKNQRILNIFKDLSEGNINIEEVLSSPVATGHKGAEYIKEFFTSRGSPSREPDTEQPALTVGDSL